MNIEFRIEKGFVRYLGGGCGEFTLRWNCPHCDIVVSELAATENDIERKKTEISEDPQCYMCRDKKRNQKLLFAE